MNKRLKKVLLLGSGGLRIGQAGEFDYSGSQAIKALKEEGIRVVLVNPNIATVQTDENMADEIYLQPLQLTTLTAIIAKERPDAILLGFGGQTALNLGLLLEEQGVLARYHVQVLGTSVHTIRLSEDRALFKAELDKIGVKSAKSVGVTTVDNAVVAARTIGYPLMMRSGFSLGGLGSGIIHDEVMLRHRAAMALSSAPQILIEECLIGWHEFEYEIVRDTDGNTLTVCNMENFDPMGIHTGESIVVCPSQSLNNTEYHFLREIAIKVANHFNIVGECNIQYAVHLKTGEYRVIEINPRLSRSSALASKATGYPLAFVAAKLALGYKLHDIKNSITQKTYAFFEPALDYVVVKIPRWDTQKLKAAQRRIGTEMKSVGEVMAIGRSFPEALQKAVGMLNIGASDLSDYPQHIPDLEQEIAEATDRRLFAIYRCLKQGYTVARIVELSGIDPWFLHHLAALAQFENTMNHDTLNRESLCRAKKYGFSDRGIAKITAHTEQAIRALRMNWGIKPFIKQIDTLAGECDAQTNYLYVTYHADSHDIEPSAKPAVMVLGSGPYSIGSSVEFDWCAVNTARTLTRLGEKTIIINSNPETVSTDYDESDRLYFEQLTLERVQDIADFENMKGIIVAVGGQIANNIALALSRNGYRLLGTQADSIEMAENREKFSSLLSQLGIDQPRWATATTLTSAKQFAEQVGYPVLLRPSYVLSGSAMNVVFDESQLATFLQEASLVSADYPVVISEFIEHAKELEIDGVADHGNVVIEAMSEHIENAGVHSGDATIVLPPQKLYLETIRRTKKITRDIARALNITGPFNIQFIAKNNDIKVIECNLRASRSCPFASKVTGHNFIQIATEVIMNRFVKKNYETLELDYVGVKSPQFSYSRLKGANPVAHVEMASTGEVACLGENLHEAFLSSWFATDQRICGKRMIVSIGGEHKIKFLELLRCLDELGWDIYATDGTHAFLASHGIGSVYLFTASEFQEPNIKTMISHHAVDLIINIPRNKHYATHTQVTDGYILRRLAIDHHIPLITNLQIAQLLLECLIKSNHKPFVVRSWNEYLAKHAEVASITDSEAV